MRYLQTPTFVLSSNVSLFNYSTFFWISFFPRKIQFLKKQWIKKAPVEWLSLILLGMGSSLLIQLKWNVILVQLQPAYILFQKIWLLFAFRRLQIRFYFYLGCWSTISKCSFCREKKKQSFSFPVHRDGLVCVRNTTRFIDERMHACECLLCVDFEKYVCQNLFHCCYLYFWLDHLVDRFIIKQ